MNDTLLHILWGLAGMAALLAAGYLLSMDRSKIRLRVVASALALQFVFGFLVLFVPWGAKALRWVSSGVQAVINSSNKGIEFLVGPLLPENDLIFALQVLPVIIYFAALTSVLYYLGILQWVVRIIGGGIQKVVGTERAESANAAASIFVGQTEAPLLIRPYLKQLSMSGLFAVMTAGLATVAGSVLVGYALIGAKLSYLIAASFMAAPGALVFAKLLVPEGVELSRTEESKQPDGVPDEPPADGQAEDTDVFGDEDEPRNVIDAAAQGAADGLKLALNIGAMLMAFISLIALINLLLGKVGSVVGWDSLSFELLLGYLFAPVMFLIGVPWHEAIDAGSFIGQKVVVNEFVAFTNYAPEADNFGVRTQAIITFALTGFANLGSIGILIGGLGGLAPDRRSDIARLGLRSVLAATLANLMSAAIAGMMLG